MSRARDVASNNLAVDTTPTLQGDLTMGSHSIADGVLAVKSGGAPSELRLYCEAGSHFVSLKSPAHSAYSGNHSITLPPNDGNTDQFLKTDGNGVTTWSDIPASGGAWTYLSEVVSTSSTTVDFSNVFSSTYDNYRIVANNVGGNTTNVNIGAKVEFSNNIGSYTAYAYHVFLYPNNPPAYQYAGGSLFTHHQNNTGSAAQRCNFYVDIFNPLSTNAKSLLAHGVGYSGFSAISVNVIHAWLLDYTTTNQSGIQFYASSGTLTGTFRLYGFAKS